MSYRIFNTGNIMCIGNIGILPYTNAYGDILIVDLMLILSTHNANSSCVCHYLGFPSIVLLMIQVRFLLVDLANTLPYG